MLVGALLEVITLHYSTTIVSVVNVLPLLSTSLSPMKKHCYGDEYFMVQYSPNYKMFSNRDTNVIFNSKIHFQN